MASAPHGCHHKSASPFAVSNKLKLAFLFSFLLFALSYLPYLTPLNLAFKSYLGLIWWAVILGLFIGGLIDYFVPSSYINRILGRKGIRSVLNAALAGFLLSACSHGILAIAIQLYKKGAPVSSVVAFLLASPWANLPVTILLFGFFGLNALWIIGAAMLIAVITGLIFQHLETKGFIEQPLEAVESNLAVTGSAKPFVWLDSIKGVTASTISLANMVLWWIILGFMIAVLIKAYLPHHLISTYFDASLSGLGLTLLVATFIEVCSEGSAPIAFEIFDQTGHLGAPFVFLMAGVVTDYTEIGLLWTNIGKRTAIWLPVITVPQVLLVGVLFNSML